VSSSNVAKEVLWPKDSNILVRAVFLYVGEGSSTIILFADGGGYRSLLVDVNLDVQNGGIDVPKLVADLVEAQGLAAFVNTHPHDDHLRGVTQLSEAVDIAQVWHSGHRPGKQYEDAYKSLMEVVKKVKDSGGEEVVLLGSRDEKVLGDAKYFVLAPAEYVADDIQDEPPDKRYQRIHEQCAVLKFGTEPSWIMTPGDADRDAFEKHITQYHRERLGAVALAGAHHGSRTFFRYDEKSDPFLDGLNAIDPQYVVLSAPKREESPHDHPHADAVRFYADKVGSDNVLHTGENRYSYICDIYRDGTYGGIIDDQGALAEAYPLEEESGGTDQKDGENTKRRAPVIIVPTKIDDRPMGIE